MKGTESAGVPPAMNAKREDVTENSSGEEIRACGACVRDARALSNKVSL